MLDPSGPNCHIRCLRFETLTPSYEGQPGFDSIPVIRDYKSMPLDEPISFSEMSIHSNYGEQVLMVCMDCWRPPLACTMLTSKQMNFAKIGIPFAEVSPSRLSSFRGRMDTIIR
jgi:hypothetical protein